MQIQGQKTRIISLCFMFSCSLEAMLQEKGVLMHCTKQQVHVGATGEDTKAKMSVYNCTHLAQLGLDRGLTLIATFL